MFSLSVAVKRAPRLLAIAGMALALTATPTFAVADPSTPSNDVSPNNDSQTITTMDVVELVPDIVADELIERHEPSATDPSQAAEQDS